MILIVYSLIHSQRIWYSRHYSLYSVEVTSSVLTWRVMSVIRSNCKECCRSTRVRAMRINCNPLIILLSNKKNYLKLFTFPLKFNPFRLRNSRTTESRRIFVNISLKIDAIGLSRKFRVQFLCMSASVLDVAIKFEKNESLDFSEEACNYLKILFGGNSKNLKREIGKLKCPI